jgi:hypothetical protein
MTYAQGLSHLMRRPRRHDGVPNFGATADAASRGVNPTLAMLGLLAVAVPLFALTFLVERKFK